MNLERCETVPKAHLQMTVSSGDQSCERFEIHGTLSTAKLNFIYVTTSKPTQRCESQAEKRM